MYKKIVDVQTRSTGNDCRKIDTILGLHEWVVSEGRKLFFFQMK
jgi:hypothetical protein